ncbi:MAG: transposase [Turicibacter sp.]|nr:transposase [Turicibacter sp.]
MGTTATGLSENVVIQTYGKRWSIEVYFKMCKSHLRLAKYQAISYDGIVAHTATVTVGYLILALKQREESDPRTIGELFYLMTAEISDLSYAEAISYLVSLFTDALESDTLLDEKIIDRILGEFVARLPHRFRIRFGEVTLAS